MSRKRKKTPEEIEAERETRENEERRRAARKAFLASLTPHERYREENRALLAFKESMRRAKKEQALPEWLTEDHKEQIHAFYEEAEALFFLTGVEHEVDHIVPYSGSNKHGVNVICGLHVPWNLRVIPKSMNRRRGSWFYIREAEEILPPWLQDQPPWFDNDDGDERPF